MILPYALLFSVLTVFASLASLLTFSRLWQIKEWRFDRLREHLRENGWYRQLLGTVRPLLTGTLLFLSGLKIFWGTDGIIVCLLTLAALSLVQMVRSKHRPVWTAKAKAIVALSAAIIFVASFGVVIVGDRNPEWNALLVATLLIIPLFTPAFAILSWTILRPVDHALKNKILKRAMELRSSHPNLRVIGITGSVGKTTVKEMMSHVLKDVGALTTPERVNTEMGVAAWLTNILSAEPADSTRIVIVEMGAYKKGEIALLCRIAKPQFGIITYVGNQHLSLFGSPEAIIEAKGELFAALPSEGKAFGNSDNAAYEVLKKRCICPVVAVGTGQHADVLATDIEETGSGIRFQTLGTVFNVPVAGTHNVTGALLAIAVARELGMKPAEIAAKLQSFKRMSRTFELKKVGDVTVLDDTYNSSPASVQAAIVWAAKQPQHKKILVLEGIIELGDAEGRIHTELATLASPVFTEAYAAHPRHLAYLRDGGFGPRARMASERHEKAENGSLIVFVGRLSSSVMSRFT